MSRSRRDPTRPLIRVPSLSRHPCSEDGCDRPAKSRGLCHTHYMRLWSAANRDKIVTYRDRRGREVNAAYSRAWHRANPFRKATAAANRKAQRLGIVGELTAQAVIDRFAFFGYRCWICGEPDANSIDHVIPFFRGGLNLPANVRPAHMPCNSRRGTLDFRSVTRRTECGRGHQLNGERTCRECHRTWAREYSRRKRGSVLRHHASPLERVLALAAVRDGVATRDIAAALGVVPSTVNRWRKKVDV